MWDFLMCFIQLVSPPENAEPTATAKNSADRPTRNSGAARPRQTTGWG